MDKQIRILTGAVVKGEREGLYRGKASTSAVDRSGEIVLPGAFRNIADWLARNPVMYYDHAWTTSITVSESSLPVGRAVEAAVSEKDLVIGWEFSDLPFASQVRALVDGGFLNSLSVGFLPKAWDFDPDGRRVYTDVELLEVSIVGIPANAEATIMRGLRERGVSEKEAARLAAVYEELKSGRAAKETERGNRAGAQSAGPGGALTPFERQTIAKHMGGIKL